MSASAYHQCSPAREKAARPGLPARLLACAALTACVAACKLYEHDYDAAIQEPCVETNEPLTPTLASKVSVEPDVLLAKVKGKPTALLRWTVGRATDIAFTMSNPDIYYVRSRINPLLEPYSDTFCNGRTEIRGTLTMKTDDGQLNESQQVVLIGNGSDDAHALVSLPAAKIKGTYQQRPRTDERCLDRLDVRVLFGPDGASGTITEISTLRACPNGPSDDPDEELGVAQWGHRPLNY